MKSSYLVIACLILTAGTMAPPLFSAEEDSSDISKPTSVNSESFSPGHLKNKMGMGVAFSSPVYLANLRWWFEDNMALDLYAGGNYSEQSGANFTNQLITVPRWAWGMGFGLRENIAHPIEDVVIQAIQTATYDAVLSQYSSNSQTNANQNQDLTAYLGLGFEAFLPFWKNLSIEGSIGIQAGAHWIQQKETLNGYPGPNVNYETDLNTISAQVANNINGIFNTAAHFYF